MSRSARQDPEAVRRILRTVLFGLSMAVWAPVFAPLYLMAGARVSALVVTVGGLVCVMLMFVLRRGVPVGVVVHLLVALLFAVLCGLAVLTGGIVAPSLTWLCSVPIVAVLIGGRWAGAFWVSLSIGAAAAFFALDQAGVTFRTEATADGQHWLHVASLCGIAGCATLLTGIFRRTEREARLQTEEARRLADEANRAKGNFLAKMSHEIRTPMGGVIGMTQLALETSLTTEQRNYLEAAKESAENLLAVVNDILDFSRMEAGRLELRPQAFRLRNLLRRTMTLLAVRADPDQVTVTWNVAEGVPDILIADMGRLRQVLINLVGNAIKFTAAGQVDVGVDLARASSGGSALSERFPASRQDSAGQPLAASGEAAHGGTTLVVVVRDTGIGIPRDQQAKIFEEFEQADGSMSRMFGGTGLGLSITRGLITLMGGRIEVESRVGIGSTFRFTLPVGVGSETDLEAEEASGSGLSEAEAAQIAGLRVLVVDDNRTNQVLIRGLLKKQGCDVTVADSGEEALERIAAQEFDVVLMDVEMPGMDGFEATRRIRRNETDQTRLPVFALTAHALPNYGLRCLAAGMDGYLSKPLRIPQLLDTILRVTASRNQAVT